MTSPRGRQRDYGPVDASPVKSFFVSMLTRDIKLEEAILDLLDNCVDGILRSSKLRKGGKPYKGFWAEVAYDKSAFSISDNCGGIPWDLHDYAFRMGRAAGRPEDAAGGVGVYGIGMKRAIFKMGERSRISTQTATDAYEVDITPAWIRDEEDWSIPVRPASKSMKENGTTVVIGKLHAGIAESFSSHKHAFTTDLTNMVATHYAFIIDKGFCVKINGQDVSARPTQLIFTEKTAAAGPAIRPFMFKAEVKGVSVFLAVGLTRAIPSADEISDAQEEMRHSSLDAGWTVLCNDRAVLYCDRGELTGWGEAGVPRYHTQFIAISGVVEFQSDDASKLPTTTTKRGIDASSALYLQVKNKMREGMKMFTDFTNKWKGRADDSKAYMAKGKAMSLGQIRAAAEALDFRPTRKTVPKGKQYKPSLPMPARPESRTRRISFTKDVDDVTSVAEHIFGDATTAPSDVGEKCFDLILREAKR